MWRWMDSFGRCYLLLSDSASLDSEEKVLHHALRLTDQELSCRQMQPTGPKTGQCRSWFQRGRLPLASIISPGGWWMVDGGYGLEAVRVLLLLHTSVHARSWPGPGLSRPEDYGQVSTSSFGGSFGFLAFGPRWRQEVVASGRQWWSQVRYRDVRHGLGGRLRV